MPSVYVHIPFCQSRCIYCDFYSTTNISLQTEYVDCLKREIELRKSEWPLRARTYSIYIGGGTPSTLPITLLGKILDMVTEAFLPTDNAEITVEANPDDVTQDWVSGLRQTPVNRVSMGVQTFYDPLLKILRRRHSGQQAKQAVRLLQDAGYRNISIDLIYGLPTQSVEMWNQDVEEALQLGVPHISAYSLMFEEGTALSRMLENGLVEEMPDEESWRCYEWLCRKTAEAGYEHYEISNFGKPGYHSQHNSGYWSGEMYLGFGAGAHSYDGGRVRKANGDSLEGYIKALKAGKTFYEEEVLSDEDLFNEFVMTRLRTSSGFSVEEMEARFGKRATCQCQNAMRPHLQNGNLVQIGSQVCLSRQGVFVSNDVISDLFKTDN